MDTLAKRRRDDEDDDEIMLFLLPALYLLGSTREPRQKIPRHTSRMPGKERLEEILNGHVKDCRVAFRMEPNIFKAIATYLRDEHLLRDTRGVRVEEQFAFFMYMLSHNASYEDIQFQFKHSGETIHRHIKAIFKMVPNLSRRFVKPTVVTETHWKISTDPRFFPYFKLYDGHLAEGFLNLTSLPEPTSFEPSITQISDGFEDEESESTQVSLHDEDEDDDLRILDQPGRATAARPSSHDDLRILDQPGRATAARPVSDGGKKAQKGQNEAAAADGRKDVPKKQKKEDVTHMMSQYLKVKTKQVECEAEEKAKAGSGAGDYSIAKCIGVINTMIELTGEEKADAVDVFKDAQNREIFMSLDSATRLIWIRKKCKQTQGN